MPDNGGDRYVSQDFGFPLEEACQGRGAWQADSPASSGEGKQRLNLVAIVGKTGTEELHRSYGLRIRSSWYHLQ